MPPPIVVFGTQLNVNCDNSDFGNSYDEYNRDHRQKAEDVVVA
jgi:hypothetical protein